MSGLLCSGNLRIAYVDADGIPTGNFIGVINPVKLAINSPDPETKVRASKMIENYGQALDTIIIPKAAEIELSTDDVGDKEVLGWAVNGIPSGFSQSAGAIPAAAYVAKKDRWIRLPHRGVSVVVVTNSAGDVTHALGTDYLVDGRAGMVKITNAGAIADSAEVKIAYTAAALTGQQISVGRRSEIQVCIEGDMINLATGRSVHVLVPITKLSASGGIDFVATDFGVGNLKGTAKVLPGGDGGVAKITYFDN